MRGLGVRIALDDFGTGYSSLSFLQRFPFDKIKIDRAFVNELFGRARKTSRTIARAVVRFAVSLGKTTTAEGVETKEQVEFLRAEGCTEMQGYYFGRPQRALGMHACGARADRASQGRARPGQARAGQGGCDRGVGRPSAGRPVAEQRDQHDRQGHQQHRKNFEGIDHPDTLHVIGRPLPARRISA